jgi:hypothetical protein
MLQVPARSPASWCTRQPGGAPRLSMFEAATRKASTFSDALHEVAAQLA